MLQTNESLYLSRVNAAALLDVSVPYIDKLIRCGVVTPRRVGFGKNGPRKILLLREELIRWVEAGQLRSAKVKP